MCTTWIINILRAIGRRENFVTLKFSSPRPTGPANSPLKYDLSGNPEAGYKVSFEPLEVGDHLIDVKIGGESISNCPFLIKVYDAKRVNVSEPTGGALGKPVFFSSNYFSLFNQRLFGFFSF